ncbi:MAG: phytoene desaturase family protein [Bryobacteraceae bacterium]
MPKRLLKGAAIIGAGLGGLSAAIHLRLAGYEVEVFEANPTTGGRANFLTGGGIRFDTGPTLLNYPWVFEELFHAAGRELNSYVNLRRIDPSITYRWPDGTSLTLSSDTERLRSEFERVEPGAARGLARFMEDNGEKFRLTFEKLVARNEDSPLQYFTTLTLKEALRTALWRSMYRDLKRYFRSRNICEALGSYAMYLGGSPFELSGLFTILPYGEMSGGLWLPEGGIYSLVEAMERLARELGVRFHMQRNVRRILHGNGRVEGLIFEDGEKHESHLVVSNVDLPQTLTALVEGTPPRVTMSPSVLTFYWVVDGGTRGLGHHTIFLPGNYRAAFDDLMKGRGVPQEPAFYVSVPGASDGRFASGGGAAVFVLVPVPLASRLKDTDWSEEVPRVKEYVWKRLRESGASLKVDGIQWEGTLKPQDWQRRFGLYDGSAFGAAHTLGQMGPFRMRNYSRKIRGLYFTGASTTPGTGLPMVTLSGKLTAERIQSHAR